MSTNSNDRKIGQSFQKELTKLLEGSADYKENKDFWEFLHDSYKGGKAYKEGDSLIKHSRETKSNYKRRKDLSSYTNVVAPVVDVYTSYLYSNPINRKFDVPQTYDEVLKTINKNVNLNDDSIDEFMQKVSRWTMVYGRILVIVDAPNFEGVISLQAAIDNGLLPYATIYPPTSVLNWKLSRPGSGKRHLEMLLLKEGDDDTTGEEYYKLWTTTEWFLISKNKGELKLIDNGVNKLNTIPAVSITYKDGFSDDLGDGESLIGDISYLAKRIYNLDSNAYEIIEQSAYPILEIPYRAGDSEDITIGVGNALPYDINHPEARAAWLEPPHTSLNEILQWRNQVFIDVQTLSHTLGASVDKTSESGVALEARLMSLHSTLGAMAVKLQKAEERIYNLIFSYLGIPSGAEVIYPKSFSVRDLSSDLDNAIKAKMLINSPTFNEKVEESMAIKTLSKISGDENISQADRDAIEAETAANAGVVDEANKSVNSVIDTINNG